MTNDARSRAALSAARRILRVLHPASAPGAPYDLVYSGSAVPVYVLARSLNGKVGVAIKIARHRALAEVATQGNGLAAYYVNSALVPLRDLVGVAHVHVHHLDSKARSVVFRVVNGKPAQPRWCFGKCDGPLGDGA